MIPLIAETSISYAPENVPRLPMMQDMYVERGSYDDWENTGLRALHYKADSLPVGAAYWRLRHNDETIGICVMGMSRPLLKERHALFPKITPGVDTQVSNIHRYKIINDDFRVVGRFVIDTMYRSGGIAYRFLNLASRMHGYQFIEIQSSMSKFSRFTQRAGFKMIKPIKSPRYDKGLRFMRLWFKAHPSDVEECMEEYNAMPKAAQKAAYNAVRDFYTGNSSLEKTGSRRFYSENAMDGWDMRRFLVKLNGLCFASPMYGVYFNPDAGRIDIPDRLPLLQFDKQKTDEPLVI